MRINLTQVAAIIVLSGLIFSLSIGYTNSTGAPSGATNAYAGSPKELGRTCATAGCHPGQASHRDSMISIDMPPTGYQSGETYRITVSVSHPGRVRFGFQATVQDMAGNIAGTIALINAADTRFVLAPGYITHTLAGSSGTDGQTWEFDWTAPGHMDTIYVFAAVNAANNNGTVSGDFIFIDTLKLHKNPGVGIAQPEKPLLAAPPLLLSADMHLVWHPGLRHEASVQVFHSSGALVYRGSHATEGSISIPAAHWAMGVYLVEVVVGESRGVYRVVKF